MKNVMATTNRKCLACGKTITAGRPDKKYCNDICRTAYSNEQKIKENKEIRTISLALKKNRNILKRLRGEKDFVLVNEKDLILAGFRFDYRTHYITTETQKNVYIFCFDFGYRDIGNQRYKIIQRW